MEIAISGGTGFIGSVLAAHLADKGHTIYLLTRSAKLTSTRANIRFVQWNAENETFPLSRIDAFINLAGEPINSGRWTQQRKARILTSRVQTTQGIVRQLAKLSRRPRIFVNASAIGYYGTSLDKTFTEASTTHGIDFLATTVVQWEKEASHTQLLGMRTIYARFGVVLGRKGGALPRMILPYKLFSGGTIGSGKQWLSWIHIDDVVNMISFALENEAIQGALNLTAPRPVTMQDFGKTIAKVLRKPHYFPIPSLPLRILLGEMSTLVLDGQRVLPETSVQHGYIHSYSNLEDALTDLLK